MFFTLENWKKLYESDFVSISMYFFQPQAFSLFACAKILYRRLVDDVIEIFVLLHTSARQIARVCMVTTVNICKVINIFYYQFNHFFNCAALN